MHNLIIFLSINSDLFYNHNKVLDIADTCTKTDIFLEKKLPLQLHYMPMQLK